MSLEELHGFFAALVSGPDLVMPNEYLPIVWGGSEGPEFESMEQAQEIMGAFMALWNEVAATLMAKKPLPPLLERRRKSPLGLDWANGYVRGVALRHDAWRPALDGEAMLEHVSRLVRLSEAGTDVPTRERLVAQLPESVLALHAFWLDRRTQSFQQPLGAARTSTKVGRNEPCPCGSGRKYKNCCGRTSSLH